jgi:hypothetical protein
MKKALLVALILSLACPLSYAQVLQDAPSLQIGLGGLSINRSSFDAELVAQIIAEKQEEIKVKLVKDMILRKVGIDNGVFYTYIDETINILTRERDQDVRIRNLMENTVNLAFVVVYADYYLKVISQANSSAMIAECSGNFFLSNTKYESFQDQLTGPKGRTTALKPSFLDYSPSSSPLSINDLSSLNYEADVKIDNSLDAAYLSLFIDVVAEAIRQNATLKRLGLMRTNYLQNYAVANAYLSLDDKIRRAARDTSSATYKQLILQKAWADAVFLDLKQNLEAYMRYFGLIKALHARGGDWQATLKKIREEVGNCNLSIKDLRVRYDSALTKIPDLDKLEEAELLILEETGALLDQLRYVDAKRFDYLAIYEGVRTKLTAMAKYSSEFLILAEELEGYLFCIEDNVEDNLQALGLDVDLPFIDLLARLDEFDQPETYDRYLNLLSDAGDIFGDDKKRETINFIIGLVRSFLIITDTPEEEMELELDVEGLLVALQQLQLDRYRPIRFHLTLGANYGSFVDESLGIQTATDTVQLANYAYFSEKIGIKLILMDFEYTQGQPRGAIFRYFGKNRKKLEPPSSPTISNWHLLFYGSGLVYNIVNSSSEPLFDYPILGIGTGITFFNNLDLNISYARAVQSEKRFFSSSNPGFLNIGFDIQFIEYLSRFNRKRQDNQTQKLLAGAKNGGR